MRCTARCHHVYRLAPLKRAYVRLHPQAAPGGDGVTWPQYGQDREAPLQDLAARLKRGASRAQPTRRTSLPQADGRQRPLGVTVLEDKIGQAALGEVVHALDAVDGRGFASGCRPGRSPQAALDALWLGRVRSKGPWRRNMDMRGYCDALSHEWCVRCIAHRLAARRLGRLRQQWLQAGVLEDGTQRTRETGSPPGARVSPLAANLSLHSGVDVWAHQWRQRHGPGDVRLIRYVDDSAPRRREGVLRTSVP
jgi:retron-type reverse transcriptase